VGGRPNIGIRDAWHKAAGAGDAWGDYRLFRGFAQESRNVTVRLNTGRPGA